MAIPFSMLWKVQMSLRKKVALGSVFSLTVITTVFAVVRVTSVSALTKQPDPSWSFMWSSIEQCVAIIVACLGSFRSLFTNNGARIPESKQRPANDSRNLFLRGIKRTLPSDTTLELGSLFRSSGKAEKVTAGDEDAHGWKSNTEAESTERIVSLGQV
ncbi:MAG: hypothetical protein Q9208_002360 [Pyrenodesmia sp. 3 TL-2023]